ncbi:MAG: hypothetical protein J7545_20595 [Roseofilum sp. SBFL]|uniref:sensor histidine kinase n=1 Tax=unclassified Roseofilum TaxID=2620099 RepID=UPI001B283203|nr:MULTISPECIES: HAMP domain-containing sensor histidine kinase [unclassified Roseofilum]MBP0012774.1 hypothetical protein [Roseofilum sp. SID3]MBP0025153.1 hypothetical protein [Roseofilum sp. SID2]MBP0039768.1 hypothetical protein [Roseofilum sp. SID1]MBP0044341.1 hypothetical protein [Roseofilum sp. SBFL]
MNQVNQNNDFDEQSVSIAEVLNVDIKLYIKLKTSPILEFAQVLKKEGVTFEDYNQYLDVIIHSGKQFLQLINDILELSKIEARKSELYEVDVDLYQFLKRIDQMLSLKAESKHLTLIFYPLDNVDRFLKTDEGKLRQILINLIDNSIRLLKLLRRSPTQAINHSLLGKCCKYPSILSACPTFPCF